MNVVLIGMPGCGKSTLGVLLAKALRFHFVDTDLLIQTQYGKSLCELIASDGIAAFKEKENRVISALTCDRTVIATGGSAVYGQEAMTHLSANGRIVYLKLHPQELAQRIQNIETRGIAMEPGSSLDQLYAERAPLYERYADFTIDCAGQTVETCVNAVYHRLLADGFPL